MKINHQGPLSFLTFDSLAPFSDEIIHASFMRPGGVSPPPFSTLNFKMQKGESEKNISENERRIKEALGLNHLFPMDQVHGKNVFEVRSKNDPTPPPQADALITAEKGVALMVRHADCQAALIFDPVHKVIGAIHAGWRGQVLNIYGEVVEQMEERFHCRPEDLRVAISPSLGPESAEFLNYKNELPSSFWPYQVKPFYFDLWEVARHQFLDAGVLDHNIEIARLCTAANHHDFFSYRKERITGRNATLIALR